MLLPGARSRKVVCRLAVWSLFLAAAFGVAHYAHALRAKAIYAEDLLQVAERAMHAGNEEEAASILKQAVEANPGLVAAHDLLAVIYESRGEKGKAYAQRRAAVKASPADPQAHYLLATAYVTDRRYADAIPELERVVALDPSHVAARHLLARCYLWNGQPDKAVPVLEALLDEDPQDPVAHRGLVVAREHLMAHDTHRWARSEASAE